ncbi:hypothetical protein BS47DRAFT_1364457 [Hydnum rufescens UP504]|uniref:Uncharacterized protein n=1 Tax=Hydnum rufescens UP504 TaxID=1448309 RepID=A0A9P6ARD3_9AGAM|nr:hypothetical protein BS47DRAFT_1364457 [Hydnum rufescens UP504]
MLVACQFSISRTFNFLFRKLKVLIIYLCDIGTTPNRVLFQAWKVPALSGLDPQHPTELEQDHTPTTVDVWSYRFKVITIHNLPQPTQLRQRIRSLSCVKTRPTRTWISHQHKTQCAAAQAWSARPPNMTINEISYHTPTAVSSRCTKPHNKNTAKVNTKPENEAPKSLQLTQWEAKHSTTHPPKWAPSLYENPPDRNMMKPHTKYGCAQPSHIRSRSPSNPCTMQRWRECSTTCPLQRVCGTIRVPPYTTTHPMRTWMIPYVNMDEAPPEIQTCAATWASATKSNPRTPTK